MPGRLSVGRSHSTRKTFKERWALWGLLRVLEARDPRIGTSRDEDNGYSLTRTGLQFLCAEYGNLLLKTPRLKHKLFKEEKIYLN
uniref:Uncharacterized protein n=1 Tax=Meloidogyne enterolobii TaxID=390850 RepID=A0A6V7TT17_MELEN|nr:unnamed protein product [Meloidogyne enterolobii]